jgi:hypothetical protein
MTGGKELPHLLLQHTNPRGQLGRIGNQQAYIFK